MNSKELTELIHQNTRIILPEFGAFLVKDSGEKGFNPSNVSFSPFLRYNDGMLEVYVAKKRGISKEEASKDVRAFVEALKNELLEKGFYEIEGLGELKRDQRGSLSFTLFQPDEKGNQSVKTVADNLTSKKKDSIETIPIIEKVVDIEDVWREEDKPSDDSESKEKKTRKITGSKATVEKLTATKKTPKTAKKVGESQQEPVQENIIEPVIESGQEPKQEITPINQAIPEPIFAEKNDDINSKTEVKSEPNAEYEKPIPLEQQPKKKVFARFIYTVLAIALIILLIFGIRNYYFPPIVDPLNDGFTSTIAPENKIIDRTESNDRIEKPKDEIDKAYSELTNEAKETKERLKKEDEQEEVIKNTLIKNAQIKSAENKTYSSTKYHIIAGSFKNPEYARKFLNDLNTSGYNASIVIQPSGMNAVAIGSYATREEANEAMRSYKSKLPNLWILKK